MSSSIERLMAAFAYLVLIVFLGVLITWVPRLDLGMVLLVTVILTGYDLLIHRPPTERN